MFALRKRNHSSVPSYAGAADILSRVFPRQASGGERVAESQAHGPAGNTISACFLFFPCQLGLSAESRPVKSLIFILSLDEQRFNLAQKILCAYRFYQ